jgi:hypothetical protein
MLSSKERRMATSKSERERALLGVPVKVAQEHMADEGTEVRVLSTRTKGAG